MLRHGRGNRRPGPTGGARYPHALVGIDSTAAACALLSVAEPGVDRLSFYYGARSRAENPTFFDDLIKPWPHVRIGAVE